MIAPPKALISGGAGFIGSHLVDRLLDEGWRVHVLDIAGRPYRAAANMHHCSILERTRLQAIVAAFKPDVIIHCAAQSYVVAGEHDPATDAETNIVGTINMVEAAALVGAHLIHMSSGGCVYGPVEPDDPAYRIPEIDIGIHAPISRYGAGKLAAELYVGLERRIPTTILRLGNVYGPRQRSDDGQSRIVPLMLSAKTRGVPVLLHDDGKQTRDFIHVDDVTGAVMAVLRQEAGLTGAFNVGTGIPTTLNRLAELVGVDVAYVATLRSGDIRHNCLDVAKMTGRTGWRPGISLEDGIAGLVENRPGVDVV